jgi:hypothetical protein
MKVLKVMMHLFYWLIKKMTPQESSRISPHLDFLVADNQRRLLELQNQIIETKIKTDILCTQYSKVVGGDFEPHFYSLRVNTEHGDSALYERERKSFNKIQKDRVSPKLNAPANSGRPQGTDAVIISFKDERLKRRQEPYIA